MLCLGITNGWLNCLYNEYIFFVIPKLMEKNHCFSDMIVIIYGCSKHVEYNMGVRVARWKSNNHSLFWQNYFSGLLWICSRLDNLKVQRKQSKKYPSHHYASIKQIWKLPSLQLAHTTVSVLLPLADTTATMSLQDRAQRRRPLMSQQLTQRRRPQCHYNSHRNDGHQQVENCNFFKLFTSVTIVCNLLIWVSIGSFKPQLAPNQSLLAQHSCRQPVMHAIYIFMEMLSNSMSVYYNSMYTVTGNCHYFCIFAFLPLAK